MTGLLLATLCGSESVPLPAGFVVVLDCLTYKPIGYRPGNRYMSACFVSPPEFHQIGTIAITRKVFWAQAQGILCEFCCSHAICH